MSVSHTDATSQGTTHELVDLSVNQSQVSPPTFVLEDVADVMWKAGRPLVLLLGTCGNLMTLLTVRHLKGGESTFYVYFSALAVSDLVLLYGRVLPTWIFRQFGFYLEEHHDLLCKLLTFLTQSAPLMSSWLLVSMTLQRAASVVWPHRVNVTCTPRMTRSVVCVVGLVAVVLSSHLLFGMGVQSLNGRRFCMAGDPAYSHFYYFVWSFMSLVLVAFLPSSILFISNSLLAWKVGSAVRLAGNKLRSCDEKQRRQREQTVTSITVTVMAVSVAYFFMVLPLSIYTLVYNNFLVERTANDRTFRALHRFLWSLVSLTVDSYSALNFYLYCITGSRFRKQFVSIITGRWCKWLHGNKRSEINFRMETRLSDMETE